MTMPAAAKPSRRVRLDEADRFVAWILRSSERDKGMNSALRRGLRRSPDQAITMHRYVAGWTQSFGEDEWAHYTVAALIASRPRRTRDLTAARTDAEDEAAEVTPGGEAEPEPTSPRPNLGATLAGLGGNADRVDTAERRLHLLVRQGIPGMQRHLPGLIRLLASAQITPDWGVLLRDLSWWRTDRDRIARNWLQDYYRARFREQSAAAHGTESANEPPGE